MSILRTTNSGILSMPLTPETAQALGWKIKEVKGQKGEYGNDWKCIDMDRDDICAPIKFWYKPHDKFRYCMTHLYFFADDEFGLDESSSRKRYVTTNEELLGYLEFLRQVEKYGKEMKDLWNKYMKNLKDPDEKYYEL